MIDGEAKLYMYDDNKVAPNFYINQNGEYVLLQYKKYVGAKDTGVKEFNGYVYQLLNYLGACPEIQTKLKDIHYQKGSLKKLFKKYYQCVDSEIVFEKENTKIPISIGILGGSSRTDMDLQTPKVKYKALDTLEFSPSYNITFGLFFEAFLPMNRGKWSFYTDLVLSNYSFGGTYEDKTKNEYQPLFHRVGEVSVAQSQLRINNLLKYRIGNTPVFIGVGMVNALTIKTSEDKYLVQDIVYNPPAILRDTDFLRNANKRETGYIFSLGISGLKRFGLEVRYERSDGVSNFLGARTPTKRFYFLGKFVFN
ncbi:MAG: hypothetical protein R3E32_12535 [Chitinophagales bacterium]